MKYLNSQQLAFLLDIKKEDARAMMCNAWTKHNGIKKTEDVIGGVAVAVPRAKRKGNRVEDDLPIAMEIEILSRELNLPHLQMSCDDIENNYLERKASKKWILYDYPEKKIMSMRESDKKPPFKLTIPPGLKSMLPQSVVDQILSHWRTFHNLAV